MRGANNRHYLLNMPPPPLMALMSPARVRRVIALIAMVMLFGMLVIGTRPLQVRVADPATAMGDSTRQFWYISIFVMLILGSQCYNNMQRLWVLPPSMALVLVWSAVTLFWSADPGIGMRRLLLTAILIWLIFRICDELGFRRSMAALRIILAVALVLNFAAVAASPVAVHQEGERMDLNLVGCWRGLLEHKNYTGALCAVTVLAFVFGGNHWRLLPRAAVLAGSSYFLYRTGSKTSMNILLVAIGTGWLYLLYSPAYRAFLVPLAMVAGAGISYFVTTRWGVIVAPLYSPDQSLLTGRVVIWPVVLDYWYDHPWGAGFGSFWNVGLDGPVFRYNQDWVARLGNGHNGYLDLLVTIGPVGLALVMLAVFVSPLTSLLTSLTLPRGAAAWIVSVIVFAFGHNLTELTLLDRDALLEVHLMFALGQLAALLRASGEAKAVRSKGAVETRGGADAVVADTNAAMVGGTL